MLDTGNDNGQEGVFSKFMSTLRLGDWSLASGASIERLYKPPPAPPLSTFELTPEVKRRLAFQPRCMKMAKKQKPMKPGKRGC